MTDKIASIESGDDIRSRAGPAPGPGDIRHRSRRVLGLKARTGDAFVKRGGAHAGVRGRVVVMGMGKSGHIGRKIAATLASTGTPGHVCAPGEASHGDLGMIKPVDLVLAISNGGESEEITAILPVLKRQGVPLVAMTGNVRSTLARHADIVLDSGVEKEACPLNLAPTASTTAQLALGDALAVALLDARGFKAEDFARSHPGGALGRKLLTLVRDVMRTGTEVPQVGPDAPFGELMREMSDKGWAPRPWWARMARCWGCSPLATCAACRARRGPARRCRARHHERQPAHHSRRRAGGGGGGADGAIPHHAACWWWMNAEGRLCGAVNTNDLLRAKVI
jgi:arabinose-5-phosphate isomerase